MMLLVQLLAVAIFLLFLLKEYKQNGAKNLPPGPPGLPIIGNIHQLDQHVLPYSLWELSNKYGPLMSLRLGSVPTLVVSSARMAREVLRTHDLAFSNRPPLCSLQKLSYGGKSMSFSLYGDYWRKIRKVGVEHLFSSNRVLSFLPVRVDEISQMVAKISQDAASSKLTNLSDLAMFLTSGIICRVAFGKRYEEGKEIRRFEKLLNEVQAMAGGFFFQDYFPYIGWLDMLNGMSKRLKKICQEMDAFYQEIINEHLDPKRPKSDTEDFIDILSALRKSNDLFSRELTWDHIKGVLLDVIVAGTDTGAASVVWSMTLLMKNPRVLKKVQEEIRSIIGNKGVVEEDDIPKLPYFKALVKETLRMHPIAPLLIPRETRDHCTIDGYHIAPRTLVYINAWAIGRDPEAWENPNEFYPERFLGKSTDFRGQDYEFIPFGAGRRICPGIHLGAATIELALSNLLYLFDWELPHGVNSEDIDMTALPGITRHKKIHLILKAKIYDCNNVAAA